MPAQPTQQNLIDGESARGCSAPAVDSFVVEVYDPPVDAVDLPDFLGNLLFASGFGASVHAHPSSPPPGRYVANNADVERFKQYATIPDAEAFRDALEEFVNEFRERVAGIRPRKPWYKQAELSNADNISTESAAELTEQEPEILDAKRATGHYYALVAYATSHEVRYPKWQFSVDPVRLHTVLDQLKQYTLSCWCIHHFLHIPHVQLNGQRPRDVICDSTGSLHFLQTLIKARFAYRRH